MFRPLTEKAWEDAAEELGKYLPKANKTHLHEVIFVFLENVENLRFIRAKTRCGEQTYDHLTSELLKSIVRFIYKVRSVALDFNAQKFEEVY